MPLNIKNEDVDRLARHLAELTDETLTETVRTALRERLERLEGRRSLPRLRDQVRRMQERIADLETLDDRTEEEILGYDERGLPS